MALIQRIQFRYRGLCCRMSAASRRCIACINSGWLSGDGLLLRIAIQSVADAGVQSSRPMNTTRRLLIDAPYYVLRSVRDRLHSRRTGEVSAMPTRDPGEDAR
jgi:hypothetical protein